MTSSSEGGPLAGIRVLDLGRFPPTAYCTALLAQQGADVCRVDAPGSKPGGAGIGVGLSARKRSVALDPRHPRRNEVLRRLAGWADVLVENSRPGDMDRRGFGYSHAAEELPRLVWCSITGFGQDGPYATWSGHDITYAAHSGYLAALDSDLPWHPEMMISVPVGAMMAAAGISSALYARSVSGKGCQLDISLSEATTWLLSGFDSIINGAGFRIPASPSRRLYGCADGKYVSVAADDPRTWAALCNGLGMADLADQRVPREDWEKTTARIAEVFLRRPAAEWVAELGPAGAAIGPVNAGPDLASDPQVVARGGLVDVGGVSVPANPIRTSTPVADVAGPGRSGGAGGGATGVEPPAVGQHTRAILLEAGFSSEEIEDLLEEGVIGE